MMNNKFKTNMTKYLRDLSRSYGYSDFLSYSWILKNGVILHKDSSMSVHFEYYGPDLESQVDYSVNILVSQIFQSLSHLGNGWLVETNLISSKDQGYTTTENNRDLVSTVIDKEREEFFRSTDNVYKNKTVLSFTYKPVKKKLDDLKSVIYETEDIESTAKEDVIGDFSVVDKFLNDVDIVTTLLRTYSLYTRRLDDSETYQFLKNCINCTDIPVQAFDYKCFTNRLFLDKSLSQSEMRTGAELKVGDKYVRCISLDDLPSLYYPTILNSLNELTLDFRFSARFSYLSSEGIHSIFKSMKTAWSFKLFGGVKGFLGSLFSNTNAPINRDEHADTMLTEVEMAKTREKYGQKFGYMNLTLIVFDEDKEALLEKVTELCNVVRTEAFTPRVETANATYSFLGSLPSHGGYNVRCNPVELELFVNMMPSMGIYQGSPISTFTKLPKGSAPLVECMTAHGNRKFYLNIHEGDVGHATVIGGTGKGKSVTVSVMGSQWLKKYPNSRIIGSDSHNSMLGTVVSHQGEYIDIARDLVKLAPFINCDNKTYVTTFLNGWLLNIYSLNNQDVSANKVEKKAILDAVERVAKFDKLDRTIERFIAQLDDENVQAVFSEFNRSLPNEILSGNDEYIFDNQFVLFDKKPIRDLNRSLSEPLLDLFYYKQIDSISRDPAPFLMIIDEASFEFSHKYMRTKMFEYIKLLRHKSGAIIFATQSAVDFIGEDGDESNMTKIFDNIATQIYLPNADAAANHIVRESYEKAGLNEREISLIANAVPKREYYIKQARGSKLINFLIGDIALSFVGKTQENVKELDFMIEQCHKPNFVDIWLKNEGLM